MEHQNKSSPPFYELIDLFITQPQHIQINSRWAQIEAIHYIFHLTQRLGAKMPSRLDPKTVARIEDALRLPGLKEPAMRLTTFENFILEALLPECTPYPGPRSVWHLVC